MAQIRIAVAARKGGVGKTSIACGLGSVLANQGRRVLVVDLDPQSNPAIWADAFHSQHGYLSVLKPKKEKVGNLWCVLL